MSRTSASVRATPPWVRDTRRPAARAARDPQRVRAARAVRAARLIAAAGSAVDLADLAESSGLPEGYLRWIAGRIADLPVPQ